ncbi:M20/M25/M40 family metallo-hydrolase, partial [Roseovarius sp.]
LRVTLRTMSNARMESLIADALAEVERTKGALRVDVQWHDIFPSVVNDTDATAIAREVAKKLGHAIHEMALPMRWSEDFGRIGDDGPKATMLYIGSGETQPQLHNPDYDFPDALLPFVIDQFCGIVESLLGPLGP